MIERFIEKLIEELGATGMLVIGLYFILHKPLNLIARHVRIINHELSKLVFFVTGKLAEDKDEKDPD